VHFLLPPRGASLGTLSTGPVDSPNMPPFASLSQLVSLSACPLFSKTCCEKAVVILTARHQQAWHVFSVHASSSVLCQRSIVSRLQSVLAFRNLYKRTSASQVVRKREAMDLCAHQPTMPCVKMCIYCVLASLSLCGCLCGACVAVCVDPVRVSVWSGICVTPCEDSV
jgi:hypothetical protein